MVEQVERLEAKLEVAFPAVGEIHFFQHRRVDLVGAVAAQARKRGREAADVIRGLRVEGAGIECQSVRLARASTSQKEASQ